MAATLPRLNSGAILDVFGDDFDDVVAAVFDNDGEAPAWLKPMAAVSPPASPLLMGGGGARPAAAGPPKALALGALPGASWAVHAPAPAADAKQLVTPMHRCVNPTHAVPCAWCAPRGAAARPRGMMTATALESAKPVASRRTHRS
jgi:hypothetical protein